MQMICDTFKSAFVPLSTSHFLLDIETTGLSKINDTIVCIGILYCQDSSSTSCIRWMAENKTEEQLLLQHFLSFCLDFKSVYTYNGNAFDIPFLIARLNYHQMDDVSFKRLSFIDLKKSLSKISAQRLFIERCLNFTRQTTLSGKELAKLCSAFEAAPSEPYKVLILNHNFDELNSLHAMYEASTTLHHLSSCKVLSSTVDESYLTLHLAADFNLNTSCTVATPDFHISWQPESSTIELKLLFHKGCFKKYLSPAKDYYFIKSQNELMHKSIAQFIPKDLKRKVTPKECFVSKCACCLKLNTLRKVSEEIWYNESEQPFVEYKTNESFISMMINQVAHFLI